MTEPRVAAVPLAKLKPADWNPRTIRDVRFKNLCDSIEADPDFLWRRPVLATADGTIYAGNMRYRAASHLGMKTVPAIVEDVPERLAKERALRDNAQWGDWNDDQLAEMVYGLAADGADVKLLGIEDDELARLLGMVGVGGNEGLTDPDAIPEDVEPRTKRGDLWLLGEHRVLCGDSTSAEDVRRILDGVIPDTVCADPPYGIRAITGSKGQWGGVAERYQPLAGDESPDLAKRSFAALATIGSRLQLWWGANHYASALPDSSGWVIWYKRLGNDRNDFADCELAWTNQARRAQLFHHVWNGFLKDSEQGEERVHPTQKPVALIDACLRELDAKGTTVLDPFLGSGTTLIACEQLGRTCYGLEIEPKYVDVIVARWEQFTGRKAVLAV